MWHNMEWHGWGGHMFGWWGFIVMGLLILAGAIFILRSDSGQRPEDMPGEETPIDILERRYAQGDIDRDDFEQRKRDLLQGHRSKQVRES